MTYLFEIHYSYKINGAHGGKGVGYAQAHSAEAAEARWSADYPRSERFDYKIIKVIVSPAHIRRADAMAAFA